MDAEPLRTTLAPPRREGARRIGLSAALALALALAGTPASAADCHGLTGQYLFDVKNAALTASLKSLLGKAFKRFDQRYQVQVPFESTGDGYVYAAACMPHNCTVDEGFLGIEESSCKVFVGLLENEKFTLVRPDSAWPASLEQARKKWMTDR